MTFGTAVRTTARLFNGPPVVQSHTSSINPLHRPCTQPAHLDYVPERNSMRFCGTEHCTFTIAGSTPSQWKNMRFCGNPFQVIGRMCFLDVSRFNAPFTLLVGRLPVLTGSVASLVVCSILPSPS